LKNQRWYLEKLLVRKFEPAIIERQETS
jgi:hypothetical protein